MEDDSNFNNTQPEEPQEQPEEPTSELSKGDQVRVEKWIENVHGVEYIMGGFSGDFVKESEINGKQYAIIYHCGYRTVPMEHVSNPNIKKRSSNIEMPKGGARQGDIIIKCQGLPKKPCNKLRQVHAADKHRVTRCSKCQSTASKLATRERMKKARAKNRAKKTNNN